MRWLSDDRSARCVKLIERLSQLYPGMTPDEAFRCLLGACGQSFFVKAMGARPLEFDQLLDERFCVRMLEGAFRYSDGARRPFGEGRRS